MRPRLLRAVAGLVVATLAGLLAAGCTTVKASAKDDGWTVVDAPGGRTAALRVADVEAVVQLHGPESDFPLDVTLLNHGSAPVVVEIRPLFQGADGAAIGEIRNDRTKTGPGAPTVLHGGDSMSIPACVDGAPGAIHLALSRSRSPENERRTWTLGFRHADADYEVVAHQPDGDVKLPLRFDVALLVCDSQAASVAGDVSFALLVITLIVVAVGSYGGH